MEKIIYDTYAAAALQALIAKLPMFDTEGEFGKNISPDELQNIKKQLCQSAHSYAAWMMQTRKEYADCLESIDIKI